MARYDLEITIRGDKGSGKTLLLNLIARSLRSAGLHVDCRDEGRTCIGDMKVPDKLPQARSVLVETAED